MTQEEGNSLPEKEDDAPPPVPDEPKAGIPRKPYIYTEKRKENLAKANQVRTEKALAKKMLQSQLESMTRDLQTIYESKLQEITKSQLPTPTPVPPDPSPPPSPEKPANPPLMSSSSSSSSSSDIPIEPVKVKKGKKRAPVEESSSDSDESVPPPPRVKSRKSRKSRKQREFNYDTGSSDSSEEEYTRPRRKSSRSAKKAKKKYDEYVSSDEDDNRDYAAAHPLRNAGYASSYFKPKTVYGGRRGVPQMSGFGYGSQRGQYSGCTF